MNSEEVLKKLTLGEFRSFLEQYTRNGVLQSLFSSLESSIPRFGKLWNAKRLRSFVGIIDAMTVAERNNPTLIESSRCRRIGAGAGTVLEEVNHLLNLYTSMVNSRRQK